MTIFDCCVRPLDACCPCFIKVDEEFDRKSCILPCCEPLRRWCDLRQTVRRPFYVCMLYGCVMMLVPCVLMSSMMMWSFVKGTALYAQTTASRDCESVAVWGGVQIALCVCNFFFTWFLFTNLRRNTEERDYLYRRDLGELFEHYQNTGEEAIRLEMLSVYNAHREALRIDAQRRLDGQHLMTELQEKRAKLDDTLFDTEDGKKQAKIERREIDDEIKKLEFAALEGQSGHNTASLFELVVELARTSRRFMFHMLAILATLAWSIGGSLFLSKVACANPQLLLGCSLLVYGAYFFIVMGVGCCFCNVFAAAELSYSAQGDSLAGESEVERMLKEHESSGDKQNNV